MNSPTPFYGSGIGALSAACAGQLTPEQIAQVAMSVGFDPTTAAKMVAIALKESSGCPGATNIRAAGTNGPSDPGEESYGLWQINVGPNGNVNLPAALGINKSQLVDPTVNARAAYYLWGGSEQNLDTAWYVLRAGDNRDRYLGFLPRAQQAVATVTGSSIDVVASGTGSGMFSGVSDFIAANQSTLMTVGIGLIGFVILDLVTEN